MSGQFAISDLYGGWCDDGLWTIDRQPKEFPSKVAAQFGIFAAYLAVVRDSLTKRLQQQFQSSVEQMDRHLFSVGKLQQTVLLRDRSQWRHTYMSLVPTIQPPIMKLLTTEKNVKSKWRSMTLFPNWKRFCSWLLSQSLFSLILPNSSACWYALMLVTCSRIRCCKTADRDSFPMRWCTS